MLLAGEFEFGEKGDVIGVFEVDVEFLFFEWFADGGGRGG